MKKIFIPFVIAATTLSFAACQKEASSPAIEDELVSLNFTSANPTTKTVADAVNKTILWGKGDKISIAYTVADKWQNASGDATTNNPAKIYVSNGLAAGGETAVFNISGDFNSTATGVHQFYSVYPSSCVKSNDIKNAPSVTMTIPDVQTPAENSFDAAADMMIGKATKTYNSLSDAKTDEIPLLWQRIVSHADITLKGLQGLTENEVITTIVLTADADAKLVGDRDVNIQNGDISVPTTIADADANVLTINGTNLKVNNNNVEFWAAVMPATVKSLNIVVETNKATYTRNIESCNIVFKQNARKGLNVDMSSVTRVEKEETPDYSGEWLIVDNDMKYACMNYSSGKYYSTYQLTTLNESICETPELPDYKMVLTKIVDNSAKQGLYTIRDSKGLYIKCVNEKNISGVKTLDDACYWTITFDKEKTLWKIASTSTYYLLYNIQSPRFTTYKGTGTSVSDIKLISYKDVLPLTKPILSADKTIAVPAAGIENGSMSITVKNIKTVNTSVDGTVVTSASVSGDILTYTVSKNATTDIRKGFITLSAEGVDNVTIEVTQNGVGGAAAKTYTLQFGNPYNSADDNISSYVKPWDATRDGFTWEICNWNNNNNQWSYIGAGRKKTASVATITTKTTIPEAISTVTMTIDAINATYVNSIKMEVISATGATIETIPGTAKNGPCVFNVTEPQNDCKYKITVDCKGMTGNNAKNGFVQVSKVVYTNN